MTHQLTIGLWCSCGLLALIFLRIPIAIAMMISAVVGIYLVQGSFAAWFQLAGAPVNVTIYGLSVIPLFILMGNLATSAGLSRDLFLLASRLVSRLPGGLAVATILACAGFSTLSGSSLATAATIGRISIGQMLSRGYSPALASGTVAAGGTIGILIPPSVLLVVYGLMTEQSIRELFAAGVMPGLLLTLMFMLTAVLWVWVKPQAAPQIFTRAAEARVPLGGILGLVGLVVVVLGGLYAGYFTATEAASVGVLGTMVIALLRRGLTVKNLFDALTDTASTSAMIFFIIIGSALYATFLSVTGISSSLRTFVVGLDVAPIYVLLVILAVYIVLGCVMDSMGMVLLTIPVFYPVIVALGYDPVLFGVLVVMVVEIGLITPPLGMNIFIVRSVAPGIALQTVFLGATPFLMAFVATAAMVIYWPQIALWLPGLIK